MAKRILATQVKILHIGKYFPPYAGGMENYLRDLMVALSKRDIECAGLVHQSDLSVKSCHERYESQSLRIPITRAPVWARFLFTPISPSFPWLLNRAIKKQTPDILHLHMPNVSAFWALFLPRARRIPWITHWHSDVLGSESSKGLRFFYAFYRPFERAILKRSEAVIATSPPYLESSVALNQFINKCHVVPLGLDPSSLPIPPVQEHNTDNDTPLKVLAIGRLTYYKGFEYLIRAAAELEDIEVHLVGKGDQEARLKALTRTLGLEKKIVFHGHLAPGQLAEQFAACHCLCLPSVERTEAFGMVLLEAMYCRKATVVSDVPGSGMGWVVDDGMTGFKTPPKEVGKLSQALGKLHQNHDRMRTLGAQGRQKFDRLFHIDQSATKVAELYNKVLVEQA